MYYIYIYLYIYIFINYITKKYIFVNLYVCMFTLLSAPEILNGRAAAFEPAFETNKYLQSGAPETSWA